MNIEELREYCLKKKGATEALPFDEHTLVFKVMGKIFLITSLNEPNRFNAKCDPERAIELREQHDEIKPGWHMNKKHWNTVHTNGNLSPKQLREIIDHSYELVRDSLPKKIREGLK
jgi:predicted DNA-binding protein (MmcQ/YjbR family)